MTMCSVYVGNLDDEKFCWEGGDWNGNVPTSITSHFPPAREHYNGLYHDWLKTSEIEWKQTDFGGWVAKVSKSQILEYIEFCYGTDPSYTDPEKAMTWEGRLYQVEALQEIREQVMALPDGLRLALVATEF
jgi:hypothetical protein